MDHGGTIRDTSGWSLFMLAGVAVSDLVFLFSIPALIVLYLSIHQEIQAETDRTAREKPGVMAHAGHPH